MFVFVWFVALRAREDMWVLYMDGALCTAVEEFEDLCFEFGIELDDVVWRFF